MRDRARPLENQAVLSFTRLIWPQDGPWGSNVVAAVPRVRAGSMVSIFFGGGGGRCALRQTIDATGGAP